jgi:hypothetical protein
MCGAREYKYDSSQEYALIMLDSRPQPEYFDAGTKPGLKQGCLILV